MLDITILDEYNNLAPKVNPYRGTFSMSDFWVDCNKLTQEDLEIILKWFKDGGEFQESHTSNKYGKEVYKSTHYVLTKNLIRMSILSNTIVINTKKSKNDIDHLIEIVAKHLLKECDLKTIDNLKIKGRTIFKEDGSLFNLVKEMFGEPILIEK